jgi:hypothetical protein
VLNVSSITKQPTFGGDIVVIQHSDGLVAVQSEFYDSMKRVLAEQRPELHQAIIAYEVQQDGNQAAG